MSLTKIQIKWHYLEKVGAEIYSFMDIYRVFPQFFWTAYNFLLQSPRFIWEVCMKDSTPFYRKSPL